MRTRLHTCRAAILAAAAAMAAIPARAAAPISLELNKLEPLAAGGPGCRSYLVARNPEPPAIEQLRLDLVVFGTDGVIARRLALDLGPLPAGKTAVRLFDLPGLPCDGIGRVLVNDVLTCRAARKEGGLDEEDRAGCLDRLAVSSRIAATPMLK